jgi:fructose-specific phosphotransferase system IIA component
MPILEFLEPAAIELGLKAQNRDDVIGELAAILERTGKIKDRSALVQALLEREGLGSTGIGHGVAIPHARSKEIDRTVIAIGRSAKAIEFDAIDGKPSRLFFLLVAPDNGGNEHLFTLAKIARLIKDAKVRDRLMSAASAQELLDLIREQEKK